ncbi:MAG TPA: lysylphosphatidylglycerol synthase transmembrane domain-containing protein [Terriglobales bacterium]|nr:lysylphosphatidylglycerol synthase transmembrane domain-containing protein [Terriglobales bacterium]
MTLVEERGARAGRVGWRGTLLLAAKIVLSLGLMAFLVTRIPLHELGATLRSASVPWLGAAAALLLASNVLGAYQWQRLLRAVSIRIPFWKVLSYYHVGLFFNNFLPANIGGDFARVLDASRYGSSRAAALSTIVMDRLIGTLALGGLALATTLPVLGRFHEVGGLPMSALYVALVAFFAFSVGMLWVVLHPRLLPAVERVLSAVGLGAFRPALEDLAGRLRDFRDQRRLFVRLLAVAVVVQVCRIGVHVLVARALGLSVAVRYFFLFVPLLAVVVSLPISLNGIGVREGAGVVMFGLIGVGRASAFALQFTTYLVAVAVSLLGGLVFLVRLPRRRAGGPQMRRAS